MNGGQDTPFSVLSESRFDEQGRAIGFCIKWEKETKSENGLTIVSGTENFEIKTVQWVIFGLGESPTQRERIHLSKQCFLSTN